MTNNYRSRKDANSNKEYSEKIKLKLLLEMSREHLVVRKALSPTNISPKLKQLQAFKSIHITKLSN